MKNIHLIATDKPSRLIKNNEGKLVFAIQTLPIDEEIGCYPQHICITNDEKIKEEDYSFYPPFGVGKNIVIDGELCFHIEAKNGKGFFTQRTYQTLDRNKKIILTDNKDLIKDGIQAISDEFLQWFVKNPSCEEVEVEKGFADETAYGYNFLDYKITIPKDEPEQERMYSKKEVIEIINEYEERFRNAEFNQWFEQSKKK
jgi:hypothetical protein